MNTSSAVVSDRAVDVLVMVFVVYNDNRHHSAEHGEQRLLTADRPAVKSVNDGEIRLYNYWECPTIRENGLRQQFQVFLADLVWVIIVRLDQVPVYPSERVERRFQIVHVFPPPLSLPYQCIRQRWFGRGRGEIAFLGRPE